MLRSHTHRTHVACVSVHRTVPVATYFDLCRPMLATMMGPLEEFPVAKMLMLKVYLDAR